jgi:hypothetical protein
MFIVDYLSFVYFVHKCILNDQNGTWHKIRRLYIFLISKKNPDKEREKESYFFSHQKCLGQEQKEEQN